MAKKAVKGPQAEIKVQLSGFSFVHHGKKNANPRMLRFTLAFLATGTEHGDLGCIFEGCLLRRIKSGDLVWNPPRSWTSGGLRKTSAITKDMYNLVLRLIKGTKYPSYVGDYEAFVNQSGDKKALKPEEVDVDLPQEIEG